MKKIVNIMLIVIFTFTMSYFGRNHNLENAIAKEKGIWVLSDRIIEDKSALNDIIDLDIEGVEGKLTSTAYYKSGISKEWTKIDWNWQLPPVKLVPGNKLDMKISGEIKEWKSNYALAGVLSSRFTQFEASCCDLTGVDVGFISLDTVKGDTEGYKKLDKSFGLVPDYGDLKSNMTRKLQLRVTLNHGGRYDWVYVYQWIPENKINKTSISLQIGINKAILNSKTVELDSPPIILESRTYVPFRFIGEAFGAQIKYESDPSTKRVKTVSFEKNYKKVILFIDKNEISINNLISQIDAPPRIINNRTMVPVRIITEAFEAEIEWIAKDQKINILYEE